ncbi:MAG: hypothetical protein KKD44_00175 [Proteobacteria bacterium]|nr:hypothetical protein [Pseudomonadota bacterium]
MQYYIKAYGLCDATVNKRVKRAYFVFERICRVADKRGNYFPGLTVVNSPGDPWTISLPDGNIVLSERAVEICYQGVDENEGDARLAFIIGHELAHLANNDFWHLETFMALCGDQNPWSKRLQKFFMDGSDKVSETEKNRLSISKMKEMAADDLGFIYAAISGFSMDTLVIDPKGKDFFTYWMEQTHTKADISHPHPKERSRLLQVRLKTLTEKIEFFKFGTRFSYFGRYEDAIYFLKEFQKVFPSREVLNNLGYCYLQMAIKKMPFDLAYQYWFPSIIDVSSRAEHLTSRSGGDSTFLSDDARKLLTLSINCFEKACKADTSYIPSRINLVTAYFYMGDIFKARAMIEEALKLSPDDPEIKGLQALIMIEEVPAVDMWPYSVKMLKTLTQKKDAPAFLQYNLARLLEKRKRTGEAQRIWKTLAESPEKLSEPFRLTVLKKTGMLNSKIADTESHESPLPWNIQVRIGQNLKEGGTQNLVSDWKRISYSWENGMIKGDIYMDPLGTCLLAVNDFVEMVVLRDRLGTVSELQKQFGTPLKRSVWGQTVWSFNPKWSVLVSGNQVSEAWVSE